MSQRTLDVHEKLAQLQQNLSAVIHGKDEVIRMLLVALAADGSVLLEDVPGVGKTTLAKTLARSIDVEYQRIQFTPDLLPSDILGTPVYNPQDGSFTFKKGPIFCSVLLADEINRASPRTQSALLEAMNERQVTIEGHRYKLEEPFLVLATQNPVEFQGTYPLPEAQLDRFLLELHIGYPDPETEVEILYDQQTEHPLDRIQPVMNREEVLALQDRVRRVHVDRSVSRYIVELVRRTRLDGRVRLGVSPRGSLMLFRAAQAAALLDGRDYVKPDDVQQMAVHVLPHRLLLTSQARFANTTPRQIIEELLQEVKVPT